MSLELIQIYADGTPLYLYIYIAQAYGIVHQGNCTLQVIVYPDIPKRRVLDT